jgi:hypothetical protein
VVDPDDTDDETTGRRLTERLLFSMLFKVSADEVVSGTSVLLLLEESAAIAALLSVGLVWLKV